MRSLGTQAPKAIEVRVPPNVNQPVFGRDSALCVRLSAYQAHLRSAGINASVDDAIDVYRMRVRLRLPLPVR